MLCEQVPILAIAALGGYCVFELVWGVITTGNADEAYQELQKVSLLPCVILIMLLHAKAHHFCRTLPTRSRTCYGRASM